MLSGDFQRKLRKLNPELRIWCGDNPNRPAGIYHVVNSEFRDICGIDKNYVPEYISYNPDGSIYKAGWRRALKILIKAGLVDRWRAQRVFGTHLEYAAPKVARRRLERKTIDQVQAKYL